MLKVTSVTFCILESEDFLGHFYNFWIVLAAFVFVLRIGCMFFLKRKGQSSEVQPTYELEGKGEVMALLLYDGISRQHTWIRLI